jgi:MFS family permease
LSGGLLAGVSWRHPFLLYLTGLAVFVLAWFVCWEPERANAAHDEGGASTTAFPWRSTLFVCGTTVLFSMVFFVQAVQHGRIFGDMGVSSPERISVFVTIASLGTVAGGYLFKRLGRVPVALRLAAAMALYGACYVGVALAPNAAIGLPLDALGQIGGGLLLPALIAWALQHYRFEHRGRGMGLWGGSFFLGQFLSPPLMTLIGGVAGSFLASVAVVGGICLLVAALLAAFKTFKG